MCMVTHEGVDMDHVDGEQHIGSICYKKDQMT